MGFFSWLTADTGDSVSNVYAAVDGGPSCRTVYLLQPDGEAPIEETAYEGYGVFGGVDAHAWLARRNLRPSALVGLDDDVVRLVGIQIDCGHYHVDVETGDKWSVFAPAAKIVDPTIREFSGTYGEIIPEFGLSANDLAASGRFVQRRHDVVTVPLKFSFDPNAVYEDLEASPDCPAQGYFFGSPDDEDDDDDGDDVYEDEEESEDERMHDLEDAD